MKREYNQYNITETVQSIWGEQDLSIKKGRLIDEVVMNFTFKDKIPAFKRAVDAANTHAKVDKILANIVLHGEGLSSVTF